MSAAIHAADPHHLVSLGTLGGEQCGTTGADYQYIHAGTIDLCEYHDYNYSFLPLASDHADDGLANRLHQCQSLPGGGKPFFVGEAGVVPNVQPPPAAQPINCGPWPTCSPVPVTAESLNLRAETFKSKITAAFTAGISGYLIWFKGPNYAATNDSYAIGDGDPTEAMMASLQLGSTTAATVPSQPALPGTAHGSGGGTSWTNSPILLVVGGGALVVVWALMFRSRRRRRSVKASLPPVAPG
jgi:hypothetical protein